MELRSSKLNIFTCMLLQPETQSPRKDPYIERNGPCLSRYKHTQEAIFLVSTNSYLQLFASISSTLIFSGFHLWKYRSIGGCAMNLNYTQQKRVDSQQLLNLSFSSQSSQTGAGSMGWRNIKNFRNNCSYWKQDFWGDLWKGNCCKDQSNSNIIKKRACIFICTIFRFQCQGNSISERTYLEKNNHYDESPPG